MACTYGRVRAGSTDVSKKVLAVLLLAGGTAFGQVFFGIRIGAPPPMPVFVAPPPCPGPSYMWIDGYWALSGRHYRWVDGYWAVPPYAGAYWVAPRYAGGRYYTGRWERGRGVGRGRAVREARGRGNGRRR